MGKIEKIKEYLNNFNNIKLISIDEKHFLTKCLFHDNSDIHNTKTFLKNYSSRNSSPCKHCRREIINQKIKNTLKETLDKKFSNLRLEKSQIKQQKTIQNFQNQIEKAKKIHNNFYIYDKVTIDNFKNTYWTINCPKHGEFQQLKKEHLRGHKCYECYRESISYNYEYFVENFIKENSPISIAKDDYNGFSKLSKFKCDIHGYFYSIPEKLVKRNIEYGCRKCLSNKSLWEEEVYEFLVLNGEKNLERNKKISKNNIQFEIDIWSPEKNIGIECNGVYWHSDKFVDKNYHSRKTDICEELNIKLIQIFEDEWKFKKDTIKNILLTTINKNNCVKCSNMHVKKISENCAKKFHEKYNIHGYKESHFSLGAFKDGNMIGCISFLHNELVNQITMATNLCKCSFKLILKFYVNNFYKSGDLIYHNDRRFCFDMFFTDIGFEKIDKIEPNFWYIFKNKRIRNCHENLIEDSSKMLKIYDSGYIVYLLNAEKIQKLFKI